MVRVPVPVLGLAVALVGINVAAGAVRWRLLLDAYSAPAPPSPPSLRRLTRLYFVAFFYNNYLPGAVAGDIVRGVATREAFGDGSVTAPMAVVAVERALGLFGLFALVALGLVFGRTPSDDPAALWGWTAAGGAGALGIVAAIALGRRVAPALPGRLGELSGRLPRIAAPGAFAVATALSLATQALIAVAGWILLVALQPGIGFVASLLVVPLAAATAFLPLTVGGAGAREAVFVALCGRLFGMQASDALAASLALWFAHLVVGAAGAALQAEAARRRAPRP